MQQPFLHAFLAGVVNMKRQRWIVSSLMIVLFLLAVLAVGPVLAQGGTPSVEWWVISSGGSAMGSGPVTLDGTLGQPVVGVSSVTGMGVSAGFWQTFWSVVSLPLIVR